MGHFNCLLVSKLILDNNLKELNAIIIDSTPNLAVHSYISKNDY